MRKVVFFGLVAILIGYGLFYWNSAKSQNNSNNLPNYTSWEKKSSEAVVRLDGKEVILSGEFYSKTDMEKLRRDSVSVLYGTNNKPWLLIHTIESGERRSEGVHTAGIKDYLYEMKNGKWVLVRDLSTFASPDEIREFIKTNYKLEFK